MGVEIVPTTFKGLILTGIDGNNKFTNTGGARKPRPAIPVRHALLALAGQGLNAGPGTLDPPRRAEIR